ARLRGDLGGGGAIARRELCRAADGGVRHQSFSTLRSGRLKARMTSPAKVAIAAIIRKKCILSIVLQKLPSQPLPKWPTKLVPSHTPIIIESTRTGATFDTSESPTGDR